MDIELSGTQPQLHMPVAAIVSPARVKRSFLQP